MQWNSLAQKAVQHQHFTHRSIVKNDVGNAVPVEVAGNDLEQSPIIVILQAEEIAGPVALKNLEQPGIDIVAQDVINAITGDVSSDTSL